MLEDKLRATDWEATNEAMEEAVARESYLEWLKDCEKRSRGTRTMVCMPCLYRLHSTHFSLPWVGVKVKVGFRFKFRGGVHLAGYCIETSTDPVFQLFSGVTHNI